MSGIPGACTGVTVVRHRDCRCRKDRPRRTRRRHCRRRLGRPVAAGPARVRRALSRPGAAPQRRHPRAGVAPRPGEGAPGGRAWPPVGAALHVLNGALFGAAYAHVAPSLPLPAWARGPAGGLAEHLAPGPLSVAIDEHHPARRELPALARNPRAFAQATWRHLLFGFVLGELERRLNPPPAPPPLPFEHAISSNGHGDIEQAVGASER